MDCLLFFFGTLGDDIWQSMDFQHVGDLLLRPETTTVVIKVVKHFADHILHGAFASCQIQRIDSRRYCAQSEKKPQIKTQFGHP